VALGGGGRYDSLVADCGGPDIPAIGFSLGTERVLLAIEQDEKLKIKFDEDQYIRKPGYYLVWLGENVLKVAFSLAGFLRGKVRVEMECENKSLKAQLRQADKLRFSHALILGEEELKNKICLIKELSSGVQEEISLSASEEMLRELDEKLSPYLDAEKKADKAVDDLFHRLLSQALAELDRSKLNNNE
jgi:histidyl-tRNA synthetase